MNNFSYRCRFCASNIFFTRHLCINLTLTGPSEVFLQSKNLDSNGSGENTLGYHNFDWTGHDFIPAEEKEADVYTILL